MMAIIAVDVDITLVPSDLYWKAYLDAVGEWKETTPFEQMPQLDYALSKHYKLPEGIDALDFWRSSTTYDTMKPHDGAVECLKHFHERGHEIIFVSAVKGLHAKSKFRWLERWFPFMGGAVFTKEKKYAYCDVLIDDRNSFLCQMPAHVHKVRWETRYTQDAPDPSFFYRADNWKDVGEILDSFLQEELK